MGKGEGWGEGEGEEAKQSQANGKMDCLGAATVAETVSYLWETCKL